MTVIEFAEKRLNESCLAACDFAELMLEGVLSGRQDQRG